MYEVTNSADAASGTISVNPTQYLAFNHNMKINFSFNLSCISPRSMTPDHRITLNKRWLVSSTMHYNSEKLLSSSELYFNNTCECFSVMTALCVTELSCCDIVYKYRRSWSQWE